MFAFITSPNPEKMTFRNVSNYNDQKCWQLECSEILAIRIEMLAIISVLEMLATNVSNYLFLEVGDEC